MNVFRIAGDMSHLFSIAVLLLRLRVAKNAQGTSDVDSIRCVVLRCIVVGRRNARKAR